MMLVLTARRNEWRGAKQERTDAISKAAGVQFSVLARMLLKFCKHSVATSTVYKCCCLNIIPQYIKLLFLCRDSLAQQRSFKHFTVAPNNDTASNKPSWESFYFRENSDNAAWTRSEPETRKNDMKNTNWLSSRRESTNSDHRCKNSLRC